MKADSLKIGKVFSSGGDVHYVLPYFQREYAWEKLNWLTLIKDIFAVYQVYDEDQPPEHFMGALVVINDGTRGTMPVFRLVDGQQRLTTISLLLCALAELIAESHPSVYKKIRRLLVNEDEEGTLHYKLLPTRKYGDQDSYVAILNEQNVPPVESKIPEAYSYLRNELRIRLEQQKFEPNQLFAVLTNCLQVVFIDLDGKERPYEIFESLNYKGRSLTQADLVRNFIAMKLPEKEQTLVFEKFWAPIEQMLQEKRTVGRSGVGELTAFLRHYLSRLDKMLINEDHVYSRLRDRGGAMSVPEFKQEITTLKRFATYYDRLLRPENEPDKEIAQQLKRLNILEVSTAYPFLLYMYDNLNYGYITRQTFLEGLVILENYIVRRWLAREPTNYLNKLFPALEKEIDPYNFSKSLKKALATKNMPSDNRLRQSAENSKMYDRSSNTRQKLCLIFDTINRHLSAGSGAFTVLDDKATIEHIMPQTLTAEWKKHLGKNWQQEYELINTLGNLTMVTQTWNSSLSNASYLSKRVKLAEHGLRLNQDYFAIAPDHWDGDTIKERANFLVDKIVVIWPSSGDLPEKQVTEKPKSVKIMGETFAVTNWRDVLEQTAEYAIARCHDYDQFMAKTGRWLSEESKQSCRKLSNERWLYVNLSAESILKQCEVFLEAAGIPWDQFDVK